MPARQVLSSGGNIVWLCCMFALSQHIPKNASQFSKTTVFYITALCFIDSSLKYESIGTLVDQQRLERNKLIIKETKSLNESKNLETEVFLQYALIFSLCSLFYCMWDTHLMSVRQRCVTRDFFDPSGSIRKKLQKTCARTPQQKWRTQTRTPWNDQTATSCRMEKL